MKVEKTHRNVVTVHLDNIKKGWEQWILLRSDAHHDHPKCDREMELRHLEEARDRSALIIDNGDLFCAMQGKHDPRHDKSALREEHTGGNYFDTLVNEAAEFYGPYASNFIVFGKGNHETAVTKRHETDLTERLVEKLQRIPGARCHASGYGGFVLFRCTINRTVRKTINLCHYHGFGGGGGVNKGVGQTAKLSTLLPDPHIVLTGHTHDEWVVKIPRQRISDQGVPYRDMQLHVRVPGYKDGWVDGFAGFETEKCLGPKTSGAAWLRLFYSHPGVSYEVIQAS